MKFWENKKILLLAACVLTGIGGYWYYSDLPIDGKAVKVELLSNCIFMNAKMVEEYWSVKERDPKAPKITAVCYHEVGAPPNDIYSVSDKVFRTHLQEYKKAGYNFINAEDLASAVGRCKSVGGCG